MKIINIVSAFVWVVIMAWLNTASVYAYEGQCVTITCFDGSVHDCDFDCRTLIPSSGSGEKKSTPSYDTTPDYDWEADRAARRQAERRRREAERKMRLKEDKEDAEREDSRRKEEAQKKFLNEKARALDSMKGARSDELELKGGTPFFGVKDSPGDTLKTLGPVKGRMTTAWKQLHCGSSISGFAIEAATKGDIEEVRFLGAQALNALIGAPIRVECPKVQPPPKPYGQKTLNSSSPEVKFYRALLNATEEEATRIDEAEKKILKATIKKNKAKSEITTKKREVSRLKGEIEELKKTLQQPKVGKKEATEQVSEDQEVEEKKSAMAAAKAAMAAALAALEAAEGVEAEVDGVIRSAEKDKSGANAKLGQYEKIFNDVQTDPEMASELLDKIGK